MTTETKAEPSGAPLTPEQLEAFTTAHARAMARYDALGHMRNVAMIATAATAQALASALVEPEKLAEFAAVAETAQKSLDQAWERWDRMDQTVSQ